MTLQAYSEPVNQIGKLIFAALWRGSIAYMDLLAFCAGTLRITGCYGEADMKFSVTGKDMDRVL